MVLIGAILTKRSLLGQHILIGMVPGSLVPAAAAGARGFLDVGGYWSRNDSGGRNVASDINRALAVVGRSFRKSRSLPGLDSLPERARNVIDNVPVASPRGARTPGALCLAISDADGFDSAIGDCRGADSEPVQRGIALSKLRTDAVVGNAVSLATAIATTTGEVTVSLIEAFIRDASVNGTATLDRDLNWAQVNRRAACLNGGGGSIDAQWQSKPERRQKVGAERRDQSSTLFRFITNSTRFGTAWPGVWAWAAIRAGISASAPAQASLSSTQVTQISMATTRSGCPT